MSDLLKYFDVAYLVNLPERTDRLKAATRELANVGWTLGAGGVQLYPAQKLTERAGFPSPEIRGCFQSHLDCIRMAHLQGKKSLLMIEDDFALTSTIGALTPSIISQLEAKRWDFFYLGHEYTGPIPSANSQTTEVKLVPFGAEIRTTHCYAINGRIFSRLLEHLERVAAGVEGDQEFGPMPIDGAFNIFRRINSDVQTLIAQPKICWQLSSRSDITPRSFDRIPWLRPFIRTLRNVKATIIQWYS
jgi:GR25 family glycosyltransferase involved in LPS biosynthesis